MSAVMSRGLRVGGLHWVRLRAEDQSALPLLERRESRLHLAFDNYVTVCEAGVPEPVERFDLGADLGRWPTACTDCRAIMQAALGIGDPR